MSIELVKLVSQFEKEKYLKDGDNWSAWLLEFGLVFGMYDEDVMPHIKGERSPPNDPVALVAWKKKDRDIKYVMSRVIANDTLKQEYFDVEKLTTTTAADIFSALKTSLAGDNRASRRALRARLYQATHNPDKPILEYIQTIVSAAKGLTDLGHKPDDTTIPDILISNLHESWHGVRAILTASSTDPTVDQIKAVLLAHEREFPRQMEETAMYSRKDKARDTGRSGRSRPSRRRSHSRSTSRSDGEEKQYDWLNSTTTGCHRCGLIGHRASRCMAEMPQWVKDKIMAQVEKRRREREENANMAGYESYTSSSESSASDDDSHPPVHHTSSAPRRSHAHHAFTRANSESEQEAPPFVNSPIPPSVVIPATPAERRKERRRLRKLLVH